MKKENKVFVVPKEGAMIRDPKNKQILSSNGFEIDLNSKYGKYWQRRIICGDIVLKDKNITEQNSSIE